MHRRGITAITVACCALLVTTQQLSAQTGLRAEPQINTRAELDALTPKSANPYLSFLPVGVEPDYRYWTAKMQLDAQDRLRDEPRRVRGPGFSESEGNDHPSFADPLTGFSISNPIVTITGNSDGPAANTSPNPPSIEENGSIGTADPIPLTVAVGGNQSFSVLSTIGDGSFGSSGFGFGDFDFFSVAMAVGELLTVDVSAASLVPIIAVYDGAGTLLGAKAAAVLSFTAIQNATYYVAVGGASGASQNLVQLFPANPFDPSTGPGFGSEGTYAAEFSVNDADVFAVELQAGDVIGVASSVRLDLSILDATGFEEFGSSVSYNSALPSESLLPVGVSETSSVARQSGTYYIRARNFSPVTSPGTAYTLTAGIFRPSSGETLPQILFVDFDGATINAAALFGMGNNPATLSPLSSFLGGWGLGAGSQNAVIDAILASIDESLASLSATNPGIVYEIRNSRDHSDPFGSDRVSRLIVGGSTTQLGFDTIGIAESIDPGNFGHEETAVVLLDFLSAPLGNPNTLNQFPIAGGSSIIDLIGVAVGNITTHEAGHYLGNWHTDQFNGFSALQDQGGNLPGAIGIGPDLTFGTADDIDVDFVGDVLNPNEGFSGIEFQQSRAAGALLLSTSIFEDGFESGSTSAWSP